MSEIIDKKSLASVVIPAYNAEVFLERTLRSALGQTHSNIEVIVVDDGSTDRTRVIAEAVATDDDRVRIISVPNGGVAKARNIGITEARGEYVAFLDADDLWHPTKVERQVVAINSKINGSEPAAVYAFSRTIDRNDRVTGSARPLALSGYTFARFLCTTPVGNGSSLLVRHRTAVEVGGFDPSWAARGIGGCEDLDFELKIAAKYPITAVAEYLVGYREYFGNMSSNGRSMALGSVLTIAHHIEQCPELPKWVARSAVALISEYAIGKLIGAGERKLLLRELIRLLQADFGRGFEFASTILIRKLSSLISTADPVQAADCSEKAYFFDVSPEFINNVSSNSKERLRVEEVLRRLEAVDSDLAKTFAPSFDNCKELVSAATLTKPNPGPF